MERWKAMMALVLLSVLAGGCAATSGQKAVQAEQIYADGLCGRTRSSAAARWIADPEELEMLRQSFGQYRMGPPTFPEVDFDKRGVLLVQMGKRRTSGYGLALADENPARVEDGVATVTLEWREPGEDVMVAQVLTSPCVMVTLPKAGLERIDVVDQTGSRRLSLEP